MSKPAKEWWSGSVRVTVWPGEKATEQKGYAVLTFKIERHCKNLKGDRHSSTGFSKRDLLDLAKAVRAACEKLSVTERYLVGAGSANPPAPPENRLSSTGEPVSQHPRARPRRASLSKGIGRRSRRCRAAFVESLETISNDDE